MSTHNNEVNLLNCFDGSLGRDLLKLERSIIDIMVSDIFGYNAIQIGGYGHDFLLDSRIPNKFVLSEYRSSDILGRSNQSPIKSSSIDLVVLPHGLEFSANPHSVIREVERIWVPGGSFVLSSFNPTSLWGIRHTLLKYLSKKNVDAPDLLSLWRVKDWLKLLSIEIEAGRWGYYGLPVHAEKWRERLSFMESAGDRWWPIFGGIYVLKGIKRVRGMRLNISRWPAYGSVRGAVRPTRREAAKALQCQEVDNCK